MVRCATYEPGGIQRAIHQRTYPLLSRRYQLTGRKFRAGSKQPKNEKEQIKMHAERLKYMSSEQFLLLSMFFFPDRAAMHDSESAYLSIR